MSKEKLEEKGNKPNIKLVQDEYLYICEKCMLNEEDSKLLYMKIHKKSNIQIAMELHISERTVTRRFKEIKDKIIRVV